MDLTAQLSALLGNKPAPQPETPSATPVTLTPGTTQPAATTTENATQNTGSTPAPANTAAPVVSPQPQATVTLPATNIATANMPESAAPAVTTPMPQVTPPVSPAPAAPAVPPLPPLPQQNAPTATVAGTPQPEPPSMKAEVKSDAPKTEVKPDQMKVETSSPSQTASTNTPAATVATSAPMSAQSTVASATVTPPSVSQPPVSGNVTPASTPTPTAAPASTSAQAPNPASTQPQQPQKDPLADFMKNFQGNTDKKPAPHLPPLPGTAPKVEEKTTESSPLSSDKPVVPATSMDTPKPAENTMQTSAPAVPEIKAEEKKEEKKADSVVKEEAVQEKKDVSVKSDAPSMPASPAPQKVEESKPAVSAPSVLPTPPISPPPMVNKEVSPAPVQSPATTTQQPVQTPPMSQNEPTTPVNSPTTAMSIDSTRVKYWDQTQAILEELEKLFGMKLIVFYIPTYASLAEVDVRELFYHLEKIGNVEKLGLLLYGPGGSTTAAYRIIKLLRNYTKNLTVIAPDLAASAMTMMSLGANDIHMGPLSKLTPIDSSLSGHPLAPTDKDGNPISVEVNQVRKFLELVNSESYEGTKDFRQTPYQALTDKVHPIFLGSIQRMLSMSRMLTEAILSTHMTDKNRIEQIAKDLNDNYPAHGYPIMKEDLVDMGLNVVDLTKEQNMKCQDLLNYYHAFTKSSEKVEGDVKTRVRRYTCIESVGLRIWYYSEATFKMTNNDWVRLKDFEDFMRAVKAKSKHGYYIVDAVDMTQFRDWMNGKEVVLGN